MVIRDSIKTLISAFALLWLGLMLAPAIASADDLIEVGHPDVDFLFKSTKQADSYANIVLEPVSVWYPSGDEDETEPADRLRQQAIGEFADAAIARGLALHTSGVSDAIIARIQYIDLTNSTSDPQWADQFQFRVAPGFVTIVAELRDAETGEVLVRMANLQDDEGAGRDLETLLDAALTANVHEVVASN